MPQNKFTIIKKPWITEKAAAFAESGKYVFIVEKNAQAKQIKEAVGRIYGVHVVKVNVVNVPAHYGRGLQRTTQKGAYKKAIVTLKSGEKIDILPQ